MAVVLLFSNPNRNDTTTLNSQTIVIEKSLFTFTPVIDESNLSILISLESYQNPDLLALDLTDIIIVKLNDDLCDEISWNKQTENPFSIKGTLYIKMPLTTIYDTLHLEVFFGNTTKIQWDLPTSEMI